MKAILRRFGSIDRQIMILYLNMEGAATIAEVSGRLTDTVAGRISASSASKLRYKSQESLQ
ncbi:hypothetical protein GCM10007919_67370 [Rhizobium indigoferae]|nr:hypothetical protein GCM10007919_67370 [Rhizobium indigoferae]